MTGCKGKRGSVDTIQDHVVEQYSSIAEGCIECDLCQKDCLFLQQYGSPKYIANRNLEGDELLRSSFECSLCGLCTAVCPVKKLDPAAMFLAMRNQAHAEGKGFFKEHKALLSFERWGMSSLFSWYGLPKDCDTVFFPGCSMAGSRSGRVVQIYEHLRRLIPNLGIVLDCCTKPSHDLGHAEFFTGSFGEMRKSLQAMGVQKILVACPSCYKVWQDYGGKITVRTVYEELVQGGELPQVKSTQMITIHDPCSARNQLEIHKAVRDLVKGMGLKIREMKHHGRKTVCCGEGGAACYTVPDFAGNWTEIRAEESEGNQIITYCAGCTHFLSGHSRVDHVVDLFFEPEHVLLGKIQVTRSPLTWLKRFLLKRNLARLVKFEVTGKRNNKGRVVMQQSVRNNS